MSPTACPEFVPDSEFDSVATFPPADVTPFTELTNTLVFLDRFKAIAFSYYCFGKDFA
jgi:hypothetical protein